LDELTSGSLVVQVDSSLHGGCRWTFVLRLFPDTLANSNGFDLSFLYRTCGVQLQASSFKINKEPVMNWSVRQDIESDVWVVSSKAALGPGLECMVIADFEVDAQDIAYKLNDGQLKIPSVNATGYFLVSGFEHLLPVRVFKLTATSTAALRRKTFAKYRFPDADQAKRVDRLVNRRLATRLDADILIMDGNHKEIEKAEDVCVSHGGVPCN
jgi:hypothetical protein